MQTTKKAARKNNDSASSEIIHVEFSPKQLKQLQTFSKPGETPEETLNRRIQEFAAHETAPAKPETLEIELDDDVAKLLEGLSQEESDKIINECIRIYFMQKKAA